MDFTVIDNPAHNSEIITLNVLLAVRKLLQRIARATSYHKKMPSTKIVYLESLVIKSKSFKYWSEAQDLIRIVSVHIK